LCSSWQSRVGSRQEGSKLVTHAQQGAISLPVSASSIVGADSKCEYAQVPVTVTGVLNEVEEEIPVALCGDNVRLRLRGIEDTDINVGFVLTSPKAPVHVISQFEAQLVILDHKNIITAGYGAVMHVHTAAEEVSLSVRTHHITDLCAIVSDGSILSCTGSLALL